tara:strand:- start:289 stop:1137 length:849 start_codon:yes stop_codon:yes gene_type:complete
MYKTIEIKDVKLKEIYNLMISGISPRPIAFVASKDSNGNDNLAPFSYFNAFGSNPPIIGFSPANSGRTGKQKDTLLNIKETKEFTVSIVDYNMVEQTSLSSCEYDRSIDEFVKSGFLKKESSLISPPGVSDSPFIMECKLYNILELGGKPGSGNLILGEIVCFHLRENILNNNNEIDPYKLDPIARLGYNFYSRSSKGLFEVFKPKHNGVGFDELPLMIRESEKLNGNQLAKLAGVKNIPLKSNNFSHFDKLPKDQLYQLVYDLLDENNIDDAWQAIIRIIE